jgi:hypothetical protein
MIGTHDERRPIAKYSRIPSQFMKTTKALVKISRFEIAARTDSASAVVNVLLGDDR